MAAISATCVEEAGSVLLTHPVQVLPSLDSFGGFGVSQALQHHSYGFAAAPDF